jgi:glutaminyl-tRNA synthetase
MPTLAGMRRRGYPPEAIRNFCERIGVSRRDSIVDVSLLEHALREDLNARSPRAMAVLRPLRVVLENYPEGKVDEVEVPNHPTDPSFGTRKVPFSRVLYVERDDYLDDPPRKWHRLGVGREVRLRGAALVTCREVVRDEAGEPLELRCTWDAEARGGDPADGRKIRGTLHWLSAAHAVDAEVRLYDRLFRVENPLDERLGPDFLAHLSPGSLTVVTGAKIEPAIAAAKPLDRFQFERLGYFCADARDHVPGRPVFNRTIDLKDTWSKLAGKD